MNKSIVISGFYTSSVHDFTSFHEAVQLISGYEFYDTVEFYFEGSDADKECIKQLLREKALSSVYLAGYPMKQEQLHLGDLDPDRRRVALTRIKQLIDEAYDYGSDKMLFVSGVAYSSKEQNDDSMELLADSISELCAYAEHRSADYLLELTLEYFNDRGEPYHLLGPTCVSKSFVDHLRDRSIGNISLTYDLSHAIQLREDPFESISAIVPVTRHIHLANCVTRYPGDPFYGDKHPPFGWENSDVDEQALKDFVKYLKTLSLDEQTTVGIEIITPSGMDSAIVLQQGTELFIRALEDSKSLEDKDTASF